MSKDPKMFDHPRRMDLAALGGLAKADAAALVAALLDRWLGVARPDHEILERAGKTLAKVGHAGLERPALDWLDADPGDPRRLELAVWFLGGFWRAAGPALPEARIRLLEVLDQVDISSMTYLGAMSALAIAVARKGLMEEDERARVGAVLLRHLDHLESTGQLPGLTSQIQWLRRMRKEE